jgi:omega-6 fatty acid desaturase (delta-12 desaturase)
MLLAQIAVVCIAPIVGVWLFPIRHRLETARWLPRDELLPLTAAIEGCSFLELSPVLRWFTGMIGYHHIHHLAPRLPNYNLRNCHETCPELAGAARTLIFKKALTTWRYALWDEKAGRMVDFNA